MTEPKAGAAARTKKPHYLEAGRSGALSHPAGVSGTFHASFLIGRECSYLLVRSVVCFFFFFLRILKQLLLAAFKLEGLQTMGKKLAEDRGLFVLVKS